MKKFLLTTTAAVIAFGTLATVSAEARPGYHQDGRGRYVARRGGVGRAAGAAAVAGVAGALIGGAIAANSSRHYGAYNDGYGYDRPVYGAPAPYYGGY